MADNNSVEKKWTKKKGGQILAFVGAIAVVVTMGWTAKSVWLDENKCDDAELPKEASTLYTHQTSLSINGRLCLAVKGEQLFKVERAARAEKEKELADAEATVVRETKPPVAGEAKSPALQKAEKEVADFKTAIQALPTTKKMSVFIDDIRTPTDVTMQIGSVQGGSKVWTWKNVTLKAPEDAESDAGKIWREILSGGTNSGIRVVKIGLGESDAKLPRAVTTNSIELVVFTPWLAILGGFGLLAIAAGIVLFGWDTGLLRDRTPSTGDLAPPFSLARFQTAWWLFLAVAGFLYIWLVTGQSIKVVTGGVLTLIGIAGVSGIAARIVDKDTVPANPPQSDGFFEDILSGGSSAGLHRIQMFAWTLILGAIFIWTAVWSFTFPNFDNNLLILAGVINGVYLGFKPQEK